MEKELDRTTKFFFIPLVTWFCLSETGPISEEQFLDDSMKTERTQCYLKNTSCSLPSPVISISIDLLRKIQLMLILFVQ